MSQQTNIDPINTKGVNESGNTVHPSLIGKTNDQLPTNDQNLNVDPTQKPSMAPYNFDNSEVGKMTKEKLEQIRKDTNLTEKA